MKEARQLSSKEGRMGQTIKRSKIKTREQTKQGGQEGTNKKRKDQTMEERKQKGRRGNKEVMEKKEI